eukprot:2462148-Pyramimonas_sp.AAC.1
MGPRSAVLSGRSACGHRHWGFRWTSPWGHETPCWVGETKAGMGGRRRGWRRKRGDAGTATSKQQVGWEISPAKKPTARSRERRNCGC